MLALCANSQDSLLLRNFQFVKHDNPWLTTRNAAALTTFSTATITEAEAQLTKHKGGLTDYYGAPDALEAGVSIASFYRLSPRTVVAGSISYNNWSGQDMTGSAFINPERKPFNIAEDSLTNAGDKHRDTYRLSGSMGIDIWQGYALGARLDYTAANYAKYKDLRHKNKLMDLLLSAGIHAPVMSWLSLGANYTYHRNTESLDFGTYGKSEKVYKSLIDYGAFFGRVEQFGNEGFTDKSREMPLFEDGHGADFQLSVMPLAPVSLFGTVGFSHSTGYYGRRSPYTITYTNHSRDRFEATARLTYQPGTPSAASSSSPSAASSSSSSGVPSSSSSGVPSSSSAAPSSLRSCRSRFYLDITYSREALKNNAETYRELTNASGATYYEYYDPVETGDKTWHELDVAATALLGINGELPTWQLTVGYHYLQRKQKAYLYPYYMHQRLSNNTVSLNATHNLLTRHGVWSFTLSGAFLKGDGKPFTVNTFVTPSAGQEPPAMMSAFLYREHQYLTAPQYHIGGSVKYAFRFPGTRMKTHVCLSASHRKANQSNDYSTGSDRTQLSVAVGCTF